MMQLHKATPRNSAKAPLKAAGAIAQYCHKTLFALLLCLALLLPLGACAKQDVTSPSAPETDAATLPALSPEREVTAGDAAAILEYLTSPQLRGRAVGSDANVTAAHAIAGALEALGYAPFAEDFCIPYADHLVRQEDAEARLTLIAADGTRTELTAGTDYIYYPVYAPIDVTLPLSDDEAAATAGKAIYYAPDGNARMLAEDHPDVISFRCRELAETTTLNNNLETRRGAFFQLDARFSDLLAQPGMQASIHLNACAAEGEALNVAAIRRGSAGKTALILSAHFDGSGFCGDAYYPSAYDNGSGLTTLLLTAGMLAGSELEPDLIFAAFNGEETGLNGSKALATALCEGYESVAVINIDCVGLASDDGFTLSGDALHFPELTQTLDNYQPCAMEMLSDHLSFDGLSNVFAVNLSDLSAMEYASSLMHTRGDTMENISPDRLLRAARLLAGYAEGGSYPTVGADTEDMVCLYELPYKLSAIENFNTAFFDALPRTAGSVFDGSYASYDELTAATGIPFLHTDAPLDDSGVYLNVWSNDDQSSSAEPVYEVSAYATSVYDGVPVWQECRCFLGQSVESSIKNYGTEQSRVVQRSYQIESLDAEATIIWLESAADGSSVVAGFVYDNVLYTCEMSASAEQMEQYLEGYHF